jgi:hypothetical protein
MTKPNQLSLNDLNDLTELTLPIELSLPNLPT